MINLDHISLSTTHIPIEWIFEKYCNLNVSLMGQSHLMKSIFNHEDTASMRLFIMNGEYMFKDFSSGFGGTAITLVSKVFNISELEASQKVIEDYNNYIKANPEVEKKELKIERYEITDFKTRKWNSYDAKYWLDFKIGSDILGDYKVKPLESTTCIKYSNDIIIDTFVIKKGFMYGYFKKDGTLYKVYTPRNPKKKFFKIKDYLQGSEQLQFNKALLIITSSLKDIMSLKSLNINAEAIAPDTERVLIDKNVIKALRSKYLDCITLFDNDSTGTEAGLIYKENYGIRPVVLNLEKDPSDSIKKHGKEVVRNTLKQII